MMTSLNKDDVIFYLMTSSDKSPKVNGTEKERNSRKVSEKEREG